MTEELESGSVVSSPCYEIMVRAQLSLPMEEGKEEMSSSCVCVGGDVYVCACVCVGRACVCVCVGTHRHTHIT